MYKLRETSYELCQVKRVVFLSMAGKLWKFMDGMYIVINISWNILFTVQIVEGAPFRPMILIVISNISNNNNNNNT